MRWLLEIGHMFDWITPAWGFVQDVIHDPTPLQSNSWTFFLPYDEVLAAGWNASQVEIMLNKNGVKTWGKQITNGEYFISVKLDQAHWAEYLMQRNGIPLNEQFLPPISAFDKNSIPHRR